MLDHTRRIKSGGKGSRTLSFENAEQAHQSAKYRIPLYHEICAEQARKMKGRKA